MNADLRGAFMPSWNIHIAQTQEVLARDCSLTRAVRDQNAFLFGNLVPDIRVGYMVPGIADPIPYRITHFAKPEPIPKPREDEFWRTYVAPVLHGLDGSRVVALSIEAERDRINRIHYPARYENEPALKKDPQQVAAANSTAAADVEASCVDLTLGTWAHLLADNIWNTRVNEYLEAHGGRPSDSFRIKKQSDFDWFGRSRPLHLIPVASARLIEAAARFAQYPIERDLVIATAGVAHETVRVNEGTDQHPPYQLLTDEFFAQTFAEVVEQTVSLFEERA